MSQRMEVLIEEWCWTGVILLGVLWLGALLFQGCVWLVS
jgi:hypothetical protein